MMEEANLRRFYYSRNPVIRWYQWGRLKKAVKIAGLKGNETVLDFGCNFQALKRVLPKGCKYIGFDSVPNYSDISDYSKLKNVDVAFALFVFEHLREKEVESVLQNFKKMGIKKLVVELPWEESMASRLINGLLGLEFEHVINHKIGWRAAAKAIDKHFECVKYRHHLWISWISVWEPK